MEQSKKENSFLKLCACEHVKIGSAGFVPFGLTVYVVFFFWIAGSGVDISSVSLVLWA